MIKTIGYVTFVDPSDKKARSGTVYKIREAIEAAGFEVVWIPYHRVTVRTFLFWVLLTVRNVFGRKKWLGGEHYEPIARGYAKSIDRSLVRQCDYLFFPFAGQIYPFLDTDVPAIYFSDATVPLMINYYWKHLSEKSIRMASRLDQQACQAASINIRSSHWALGSTVKDGGGHPDRSFVLELGPAFDLGHIHPIQPYQGGRLQLLFCGVDWKRKGGAMAVEVATILKNSGLDVHLTVVGPKACPEECKGSSFISFSGFLDKNADADYQRYLEVYGHSHILLLPTRAECAGIVFSEAAAFGLACYTYATGGTVDYVVSGYNGFAFLLTAGASDFASQIMSDLHEGRLPLYHANALRLSKERLSWEAWSKGFKRIIG